MQKLRQMAIYCAQRAHMDQQPPNRESLAALWLGMLAYYGYEFDAGRDVVCVRRIEPLSKKEKGKGWIGHCISIEGEYYTV